MYLVANTEADVTVHHPNPEGEESIQDRAKGLSRDNALDLESDQAHEESLITEEDPQVIPARVITLAQVVDLVANTATRLV
jgi:hypothetical protein